MPRYRALLSASTVATFLLIALGGLVRATESGLGCGNDWPHCNGRIVPVFGEYTVAIEYSHRLMAGVVLVLLAALVVQAYREHRAAKRLVTASVAAFGLVLFQALLGAVVVKLDLQVGSVVLHLATALSLLALLIYIRALTDAYEGVSRDAAPAAARSAAVAGAGVLVLLLIGAYLSELDVYRAPAGGTLGRDWPLMDGRLLPDLAQRAVAWHLLHRVAAVVAGGLIVVAYLRARRDPNVGREGSRFAHAALGLFALEVVVGAANVVSGLASGFVALHLAIAAGVWASLVGLWTVTHPRAVAVPAPGRVTGSPAVEGAR